MAPPLIDTFIVPEVPGDLYALFDYGLTTHLECGLTKIVCFNKIKNENEFVYIETSTFKKIEGLDVEWKIYSNKDNGDENQQFKVVGKSNGILIDLKSVLGKEYFGEGYSFGLANYDYFDLRKENIFPIATKGNRGGTIKTLRTYALQNLETLENRLNRIEGSYVGKYLIANYNNDLLIIENNTVVKKIEFQYLDSLKNYLNKNL